jgi:hypothetical protein
LKLCPDTQFLQCGWGTGTDGIHDFVRFVVEKGDFCAICAKNSKGENFENWNFAILVAPNLFFEKLRFA